MRMNRQGAALSAISIALVGCSQKSEQASQNSTATVNVVEAGANGAAQVPETIFEGYPVSIAKAMKAQNEAIAKASQSLHGGFTIQTVILPTPTWDPGSTVT